MGLAALLVLRRLDPERGQLVTGRARECVRCHLAWQVTPEQWVVTGGTPDCEHTTEEPANAT